MIIKPRALKKGDTIGIIAPASPFDEDKFYEGINQLKSLGFNTIFDKSIFAKKGYLAGTDERRAIELHRMFQNQEVRAIFCARGGYGSARIIPLLDQDIIKKNPKIFMGFSDITALHLFINKRCSQVTFLGPMVATQQIANFTELTKKRMLDVLTEVNPPPQIALNKDNIIRDGKASGVLLGGCMTLLIHSLGTSYEIDTENRLLLLEDRGEPPYRIDRMLSHLNAAGKFEKVSAVIFGDMESCADTNDDNSLKEIIQDMFYDKDIPIVFGLPFGHGLENYTIPLGIKACLDTNKGALSFKEAAVVY